MQQENLSRAGKITEKRQVRLAFEGMQQKATATLRGERRYVDDLLRFVKVTFQNGHSLGSIARILGLSYDDIIDLTFVLRRRMKALRQRRRKRLLSTLSWN